MGTEFTSRCFDSWAYFRKIQLDFIRPGKPIENAFIESFNGRLREECLSQHWFADLQEVRAALTSWRSDYNESRPHTSLGGLAPAEYVAKLLAESALEEAFEPRFSHRKWSSVWGRVRVHLSVPSVPAR